MRRATKGARTGHPAITGITRSCASGAGKGGVCNGSWIGPEKASNVPKSQEPDEISPPRAGGAGGGAGIVAAPSHIGAHAHAAGAASVAASAHTSASNRGKSRRAAAGLERWERIVKTPGVYPSVPAGQP